MTYLELKQLKRAEELFDRGKLDESLEILNDEQQYKKLSFKQKSHFLFLNGLILLYQNKGEDIVELGEQIFKEAQKLNKPLQLFDGLFFIVIGLGIANKFNKAFKQLEKSEVFFKLITHIPKKQLLQRKVRLSVIKGFVNFYIGNINFAEKCLRNAFIVQKELGNTFEIAWANLLMAQIMLRVKGKYSIAMEFTNKALSIAKEIKFNHFWIAWCQCGFGVINSCIGELDKSLKHSMKSLAIFKEINSKWWVAVLLNNIGETYANRSEYNLSLHHLEESLKLWEKLPESIYNFDGVIAKIIEIALEIGDSECAKKYFHRLEDIHNQRKDKGVELVYKYTKALMLKRSARIRDKAKTESLLKQVIETDTLAFDLIINAYIHLCELLLSEFRFNHDREVFDEVNQYIDRLLDIAEKSNSYLVFCETYLLQAKLSLINFDIKDARRFLSQAQKIAESQGIIRLAMKISHEHDELIKQEKLWEDLKESNASLSERWELAGLNEQIDLMARKRSIEVPPLSDEEPVLLLIISEGGMPFFSESFIKDKIFEEHLFGGFFTAINSFIHEMFSEGLDRASFGNHTLLMDSVSPFLMCYVYKGQSYLAQKRIKTFINELKSNEGVWDKFEKFYQSNRKIQSNDIPTLEPLIHEIFIEKTLH